MNTRKEHEEMNGETQTRAKENRPDFQAELTALINKYSQENESNTPDWILAKYIIGCLEAYEYAILLRDCWYNFHPWETCLKLTESKKES